MANSWVAFGILALPIVLTLSGLDWTKKVRSTLAILCAASAIVLSGYYCFLVIPGERSELEDCRGRLKEEPTSEQLAVCRASKACRRRLYAFVELRWSAGEDCRGPAQLSGSGGPANACNAKEGEAIVLDGEPTKVTPDIPAEWFRGTDYDGNAFAVKFGFPQQEAGGGRWRWGVKKSGKSDVVFHCTCPIARRETD